MRTVEFKLYREESENRSEPMESKRYWGQKTKNLQKGWELAVRCMGALTVTECGTQNTMSDFFFISKVEWFFTVINCPWCGDGEEKWRRRCPGEEGMDWVSALLKGNPPGPGRALGGEESVCLLVQSSLRHDMGVDRWGGGGVANGPSTEWHSREGAEGFYK